MSNSSQLYRGYSSRSPARNNNVHHNLPYGESGDVNHMQSFDQSETFTYGDESTILTNEGDRSLCGISESHNRYYDDANVTLQYDGALEPYDEMMLMKNVSERCHTSKSMHRMQDATQRVKDVHYALLYLMSNPEEFKEVVERRPYGNNSIAEWQEEASQDDEDETSNDDNKSTSLSALADDKTETSGNISVRSSRYRSGAQSIKPMKRDRLDSRGDATMNYIAKTMCSDASGFSSPDTPLPYLIFAHDAEVVLPQAHTASQLFGVEQVDGMELEAAAGIVPLCQLFLRWIALMPNGDHSNIIDPPGLTVMKIAGGRYRVTAAHRVVWTWMNHFDPEAIYPSLDAETMDDKENNSVDSPARIENAGAPISSTSSSKIQLGDLVTMTIVDVFETDSDGRLLSYCPTFDNRCVSKTNPTVEKVIKESTRVKHTVSTMRRTETAKMVEQTASRFFNLAGKAAVNVGGLVKRNIEDQIMTKPKNCSHNNAPNNYQIAPATGTMINGNSAPSSHKEEELLCV